MRSIKIVVIVIVLTILWYSCADHNLDDVRADGEQINLIWVKGYPQETRKDVITGLAWSLSYLGAALPKGALESAIHWQDDAVFSLAIDKLGFSTEAIQALGVLISTLKNTEEYKVRGGMDIGRFIMLTLNSSNHYYAITGAKRTLSEYKASYNFGTMQGAIVNSSVARGHRLASIAQGREIDQIAFVVAEGDGFITDQTFHELEYETLDIMTNGQLRFALYDRHGNLKAAASPELTAAGKPAKCLWCHEINLQSLNLMESVSGYYTYEQFRNILQDARHILDQYRTTLDSDIDFTRTQDHTQSELLYISFMEPSPFRIAQEWSITEAAVMVMLGGLNTHVHTEFPFLGNTLLNRTEVDGFAPYAVARVPENAREYSAYEPGIIRP